MTKAFRVVVMICIKQLAVPAASLALNLTEKRFITLYDSQCVLRQWQQCFLRHKQLQSSDS